MNDIFAKLSETEQQRKTAVLCIVVDSKGSTPRKAGSKMIIYPDGNVLGSIGGGKIEQMVVAQALEMMGKMSPLLKSFELAGELGMMCHGKMDIYLEPINPAPRLLIFGAGHVGKSVAKLSCSYGFDVHLIDNRNQVQVSLPNIQWHLQDFPAAWLDFSFYPSDFVVVTTYQHDYDTAIVSHLLNKNLAYIGMMASTRKAKQAQKTWEEMGFEDSQIQRVYTPIGVSIHCETPEEIALSIVAQLVDIRNNMK